MRLLAFSTEGVRGFSGAVQQPLAGGYTVLVAPSAPAVAVLREVLYPGESSLTSADLAVPGRLAAVVESSDSSKYRLDRELGGAWRLSRMNESGTEAELVSEETADILQFLRTSCGMPSAELFRAVAVTSADELPSRRSAPAGDRATLRARTVALREELRTTRVYEERQDELYRMQSRLRELESKLGTGSELEQQLSELAKELRKFDKLPAIPKAVLDRARDYQAFEARHESGIQEAKTEQARLESELDDLDVAPLLRDPVFLSGMAAGGLPIAAAIFFEQRLLFWLDLIGFGVAAFAAWRWIDARAAIATLSRHLRAVTERCQRLEAAFVAERNPVRDAVKACNMGTPDQLSGLFEEKENLKKRHAQIMEEIRAGRSTPEYISLAKVRDELRGRVKELETEVVKHGFARPTSEIERELRAAEAALEPQSGNAPVASAVFLGLARICASVVGQTPVESAAALKPRIEAYLSALSQRQLSSARYDVTKGFMVLSSHGETPALELAPMAQDIVYLAVKLAALERVAARKVPFLFDDPFSTLAAPQKLLGVRMAKSLAARTQVIHRTTEAPPPGLADQVGTLG